MKSTMSRTRSPFPTTPQHIDKQTQIYNQCMQIIAIDNQEQILKWLANNKLATTVSKNDKLVSVVNLCNHIFGIMLVQGEQNEAFLGRLVTYFKSTPQKLYQHIYLLRYAEEKDYEFQFLSNVLKCQNKQPISFYIKCRKHMIESGVNRGKKELLMAITADEEQWYKIVKKIFRNVKQEEMIELFTDTIKYHYLNIKKNQNQMLSGSEILRICQIISKGTKNSQSMQNLHQYNFDEAEEEMYRTEANFPEATSQYSKEKSVKRLFEKNVIDGLEAEDRYLIRVLSYKDNNIAKLLEKKHEKMIEMIADDVEDMRRSIETEKNKYVALWKEKQEILAAVDALNSLTLAYIGDDSYENEEKLVNAIDKFNTSWRHKPQYAENIEKIRVRRRNKRLLQIIQKEQKQK